MSAASDELHRRLVNHYFKSTENWNPVNHTLDGGQQLQSVVTDMATINFGGGFGKSTTLTIGTDLYYCTITPPQNKFKREKKKYNEKNHEGAEWYCNLLVFRAQAGRPNYRGETDPVLNVHILLRTLRAEQKAAKRTQNKQVDAGGWSIAH